MYQVFIADDEDIILDGICSTVRWDKLGFSIVGTARDGCSAYRGVAKLRPDVILTDIRMPGMDGLQMLQRISELCYHPIIIIITGHNEFCYARKALQLGVYDYISKPIDIMELEQLLIEIAAQLDQKRAEHDKMEELRKRIEEANNWELQNALRRYMLGGVDAHSLMKVLPENIRSKDYVAGVIVQLERFDDLTRRMKGEEIFDLTERFEQMIFYSSLRPPILVEETAGKYVLLWTSGEEQETAALRDATVRRLRMNWKECAYVTSTTGVKKGLAACAQLYNEASEALYQVFLKGGNCDYMYHEPLSNNALSRFDNGLILQTISSFDKTKIREEFDRVEQTIRQSGVNSFLLTRMLVSNVFMEIIHLLSDIRRPLGHLCESPETAYKQILSCTTLSDMMQELYRFVAAICDALAEEKRNASSVMIEQAKVFLRANFQDPKLTLEIVAKQVNVSTNYFSLLFKKTMGQSFVSYLTDLRLEHAKKLLESSDYRSYEISYRCGYENPTYFSTIFKKHFGLSPKEYREQFSRLTTG